MGLGTTCYVKIQTRSVLQNDRLNFSFLEDIHVVLEKMARNGRKTDIQASRKFDASPSRSNYDDGTLRIDECYVTCFVTLDVYDICWSHSSLVGN